MTATGSIRGHPVEYIEGQGWAHSTTRERLDLNKPWSCAKCGKYPQKCNTCGINDHDPCIGHVEGLKSACCGHGMEEPYEVLRDRAELKPELRHAATPQAALSSRPSS